jgi:hypothetical protein
MKQILFLVLIFIGFSTFGFSQTDQTEKDEKEITVCPVKLLVGAADFRFSYRYLVKTDEDGAISKIEQLGKKDTPRFIKDEDFVTCIESWKLNPSEDYFISINVGTIFTAGNKNYISISSKKEVIRINMPSIETELIIDDKKKQ